MSRHLLLDWAPSLPVSLGTSFMAWPAQLLEVVVVPRSGINALAVSEVAGRSERQWKSVLSWMLGIAGARHVLEAERYRWVAPLSAFYENAKQAVDLTGWHPSYPRTVLSISRCPASRSRLRPDYVALRSSGDGADKVEWALVEAKGTKASLVSAPSGLPSWRSQVRSVRVTVSGRAQAVQRHLVVATRVNPNGAKKRTQYIRVRAWNEEEANVAMPLLGAVEVAAASLYGLFKAMRLPQVAVGIAVAARSRYSGTDLSQQEEEATTHAEAMLSQGDETREHVVRTAWETDFGPLAIQLSPDLVTLAKHLLSARDAGAGISALVEADRRLDDSAEERRREAAMRRSISLPIGAEFSFPEEFRARVRE